MADVEFKLPSSSFEELAKIVQAYALINKPASLDDVSKRIGMNPTMVSANNGFLVAVGIIEGGKSKTVTPRGKRLGDALSHGIEEETRRLWREVVEETEFLKNVIAAIRIRRGMEEGALKAHIAYSAGVSKSSSVTTGAGSIIELLKQAGTIEDEDGKYVASSISISPDPVAIDLVATQLTSSISKVVPSNVDGTVNINIDIKINVSANELDGLGEKIRAIVDAIGAAESMEE